MASGQVWLRGKEERGKMDNNQDSFLLSSPTHKKSQAGAGKCENSFRVAIERHPFFSNLSEMFPKDGIGPAAATQPEELLVHFLKGVSSRNWRPATFQGLVSFLSQPLQGVDAVVVFPLITGRCPSRLGHYPF